MFPGGSYLEYISVDSAAYDSRDLIMIITSECFALKDTVDYFSHIKKDAGKSLLHLPSSLQHGTLDFPS